MTTSDKKLFLRWDLILRYRMIEVIVLWEGRLTTNHLQDAFGISRSQASKVINQYITDVSGEYLA
jgi:predicted DNA-binding transcriptional regulator YafY